MARNPPRRLEADADTPYSSSHEPSWTIDNVLQLNGCQQSCAVRIHRVCELNILWAHSQFESLSTAQQRNWLFDYFSTNCPNKADGTKDLKQIVYLICGKRVCLATSLVGNVVIEALPLLQHSQGVLRGKWWHFKDRSGYCHRITGVNINHLCAIATESVSGIAKQSLMTAHDSQPLQMCISLCACVRA